MKSEQLFAGVELALHDVFGTKSGSFTFFSSPLSHADAALSHRLINQSNLCLVRISRNLTEKW